MKTIYVYGDGAVWKLSPADVRAIARDKSWYEGGKYPRGKQLSAHQNLTRRGDYGAWRSLPAALYADSMGRLSAWVSAETEVYHYGDDDQIVAACEDAVAASPRRNPAPLPKLTETQIAALRYLSKARYAPGWRDTGKHCRLPTARKLASLGLVEVRAETQQERVFTGGFIKTGRPGGSQTHIDSWVAFDARLTPLGKETLAGLAR